MIRTAGPRRCKVGQKKLTPRRKPRKSGGSPSGVNAPQQQLQQGGVSQGATLQPQQQLQQQQQTQPHQHPQHGDAGDDDSVVMPSMLVRQETPLTRQYSGSADLAVFENHFYTVADANRWNQHTAARIACCTSTLGATRSPL